ncbi:TIGR04388 family protein [Leptospira yasudae]|uniref:TIGR04388 family protein n=1 Tax=Leptospira yasudae TaxID=2202201 RepID=A0A6N4QZP6_9LEPT|nr:TIGR04388 family protein [Leptospira yasudae]TGL79176.1 TIGR04388 family protein [Leptospira yasudae]TGL85693.1 TIGR04388 family protein [Leptospira yasudae]
MFGKKQPLFYISFLLICFASQNIYSQSVVVPNLNTPVFNANSMNQTFSVADDMRTIGSWDAFVFQSVSILQTQWETQVQAQISMLVNSVTASDHFASVQDYQAYVYNSLQDQASTQLLTWQDSVETEILRERSEYLSALFGANSAAIASSTSTFKNQWDSFVKNAGLNLNLSGALNQSVLNNGQQTLQGLESQWWNDFNNNLQSGLYTYQEALQGLMTNYQNLLSQINETETQYQAHLAQIKQAQSGVKDQVMSSLEGYQAFLNGNGIFWNSINVLYDNNADSYIQADCPNSHSCVTYQYNPTNSQFYLSNSCPSGQTCVDVVYDATDKKYLENLACPPTHVCDGTERTNLSIRTGLNADGKAFQNVINNVVNALQQGYIMPAIFDYTTGSLIGYNSNCLNGNTCVKGLYDLTANSFQDSNVCSVGHTCFNAVVDNTNPTSMTGSYYANNCAVGDTSCVSCPVGDSRCVSCVLGHSCQVQDMEAEFLYASNLMSTFLNSELMSVQGALTNAIDYQNGGGTNSYLYGSSTGESYDQSGLASKWGSSSFYHFAPSSNSKVAVSIFEILNDQATTGEGGLAKQIMAYVRHEITQSDLANWIMDAYSSGLTGAGSPLEGLAGLGPGITISGISHADLRAFQNEDGFVPFLGETPYCPNWAGCYSADLLNPDSGIYGANRTFSQKQNVGGAWGTNFYDYTAQEAFGWGPTYVLQPMERQQQYAWIELAFTTENNNAYANITTYQDLVLQLQSFQYDWQNNVMPAISNWTAQVASYQAQYANWQTQMQAALANAQNTFNSAVQNLQNQESVWLIQMNQVQQKAVNAFDAAQAALQNGQGQQNYNQLTQEILATMKQGRVATNLEKELSVNTDDTKGNFDSILKGLNKDANRNLPDFGLLSTIGSGFNQALTGVSNLTLLSSTNNASLDTILGYMNGIAESMRAEKQFRQNGQTNLIEAHHLKTKVVETKDQYSGETISTTYILNKDGSIQQYEYEEGKFRDMTMSDWIQKTCGSDLSNDECTKYVENKYESVDVDKSGRVTAHRNVYDGTTSLCHGGDATNYESYCFNTEDKVVTIGTPNRNQLLLGRGASRLGNLFDGRESQISDLINATFENTNAFLSSNKHTAALFAEVNAAQMRNDRNATIASADANNKVKIANMVVDYVESVLMGGMSTQAWVGQQARAATQDLIATGLVKAFDLPPDVAAFLSGGLMAHMEASKAKHALGNEAFGTGKAIHSLFNDLGLEGMEIALLRFGGAIFTYGASESTVDSYENDLKGLNQWKEFKTSMYGFAVQKYGQEQGWSPEMTSFLSQYVMDYVEMKQAKEELGRNGAALSLNSIAGELKLAIANIGGMVGEVAGSLVKTVAHFSGELGLTSEKEEKRINHEMREAINNIKLKEYKDDIRAWDADQVALASQSVKEYGRIHDWDQAKIDLWSQQASDFVVRKQAERDLHKRDDLLGGATAGGIVNPFSFAVAGAMLIDRKLFNGGITSLISKGVKGIMTSIADLGNMFGESIVSSDFRSSVYDQTKQWHNTVTQDDVKAKSQQGKMNKAFYQEKLRDMLFDQIGSFLAPGDKDAAHNLGLLLKHEIDKREARKQAREQKLKDAETVVQIAAAAAAIYFSGGAAGNGVIGWLNSASNLAKGAGLALTNGQVIAMTTSTLATMAIENKINGTNGAVAAFANGLISTATLGIKTPITGYLTYTKHQNANLITGQEEVKGGWGGGISLNVVGNGAAGETLEGALKYLQGFQQSLGGFNAGLSYGPGMGLSGNLGLNFKNGASVGLDYNFKSGNYTANASMDVWEDEATGAKIVEAWKNGKKFQPLHHAGFSASASKDGSAGLDAYYNYGNGNIPPEFRGHGGTLSFSNDGTISLSGQMQGSTFGTLAYNTDTHSFQPISLNSNFQNEFNQGVAAENAQHNYTRSQVNIATNVAQIGSNMEKPIFSQKEIDTYLPKDKDGNIDIDKANPSELLAKWNEYKDKSSKDSKAVDQWKKDVAKGAEKAGIKVDFDDGSATKPFEKLIAGLKGDILQSFGIANDGSKMIAGDGIFRLKTCFVAGTPIHTPDGLRSIEDIRVGDIVVSWNEKTNTFEKKHVTELFIHDVPQLFNIEIDGEEILRTTWNHPFRRRRTDGKGNIEELWVQVENLKIGDLILLRDNNWVPVTEIYYFNVEPTKVYNLEVQDNHTYLVGVLGVVVHNYEDSVNKLIKSSRNELSGISQTIRMISGFGGEESFDPMLVTKLKKADQELEKFASESANYDKKIGAMEVEINSDSNDLYQIRKANKDFLDAIRSWKSNNLPGIEKIRIVLKDVKDGFTESQMEAIRKFKKDVEADIKGTVTKVALDISNFGAGRKDIFSTFDDPMTKLLKDQILDMAKEVKSKQNIIEKEDRIKLNSEKIKDERKKVATFLEIHQKSKQEIFDHVLANYSENPHFEGIIREAGQNKNKNKNPLFWDLKAQAKEVTNIVGNMFTTHKLSGRDNVDKTLRDKLTYTREIQKLVWKDNAYQIEYNKGKSVYERTMGDGIRERIELDNEGYINVSILHKREDIKGKITYVEVESHKVKLDGTPVTSANSSPALLTFPNDEKIIVPRGLKEVKEFTEITNIKKTYADYMGLTEQQKQRRNEEMAKEYANTRETEKKFLNYKDSFTNVQDKIEKLQRQLNAIESLDSKNVKDKKQKIADKNAELDVAKKEMAALMPEFRKAYQANLEAFAPVRKRMVDEDRALVSKFVKDKIAAIETKQKANANEYEQLKLSDRKDRTASMEKLGIENDVLEKEKQKWKQDFEKDALNKINERDNTSAFILEDRENDLKPDSEAKFVDPVAERNKYAIENRNTLNKLYEKVPEVIRLINSTEGNQIRLEKGIIQLGVREAGQYEDFGAQIVIRSDQDNSEFGGKNSMEYNPKSGAFEYIQDGRNTCQSYSLLDLMIAAGIKFKDSGRSLIQELTRLELKLNITADMSSNTIQAYNKILASYGFEVKVLGNDQNVWRSTKEEKLAAVKRALEDGHFVNAGMYIDGPEGGIYRKPNFNMDGSIKLSLGHRVTIIGYDDKRNELIVRDSRFRDKQPKIVRYSYEDFGLVTDSWSMIIQKKK